MFYIFLNVIMFAFFYSPSAYSMEYSSLEDGPLKEKYLQEQRQQEEETQRLLGNSSRSSYTTYFDNEKKEEYEGLSEEAQEERGDKSYSIFALPLEIREEIVDFYSTGIVDSNSKKQVIPTLLYLMAIKGLLTHSYKKQLNKKIGLCHAFYIMDKMEKVNTKQEREKIRIAASLGTQGKIFWADMPSYSLWKTRVLNFNVKRQLQKYIRESKEYAVLLEKLCNEFPELLPKQVPLTTEKEKSEDPNDEYDNDQQEMDTIDNQQELDLSHIIKRYYATRHQFLNDSCHLEGKLRGAVNTTFEKLTKVRYCTPLYCCCMGVGCCAIAIAEASGPLAVVSALASFAYFSFGCGFCALFYNCSIERIKDEDCIELCTNDNIKDVCEFMTGFRNKQVYNQMAQDEIKKLAEIVSSKENNTKTGE